MVLLKRETDETRIRLPDNYDLLVAARGGNQGGLEPQKAHLYAHVLRLIVLVDEEVVDIADLLVVYVVDG
jgi:hypothetical protein